MKISETTLITLMLMTTVSAVRLRSQVRLAMSCDVNMTEFFMFYEETMHQMDEGYEKCKELHQDIDLCLNNLTLCAPPSYRGLIQSLSNCQETTVSFIKSIDCSPLGQYAQECNSAQAEKLQDCTGDQPDDDCNLPVSASVANVKFSPDC
mmetsp:Transcript_7217/g.12923  ORF Transcript_7217/g.12923 Transcript_7217/m.12923 type:complete len:150 (-) Transcript_7217:544-993(-)